MGALKDPVQIEQIKLLFLGIGFAIVWIGIAAYLMSISRRQRSIETSIEELRTRGEDAPDGRMDQHGPRL